MELRALAHYVQGAAQHGTLGIIGSALALPLNLRDRIKSKHSISKGDAPPSDAESSFDPDEVARGGTRARDGLPRIRTVPGSRNDAALTFALLCKVFQS
jgi:hypothetical protein